MRRTKIVCTLGPATDSDEILEQLIREGMDVARMNFSHGDHEEHKRRIDQLRRISEKCRKPVPIILDTKGPEIRTKNFANGKVTLTAGQHFTLACDDVDGDENENQVSVTYENLYQDLKPGNTVLIDDGLVEMEVESIEGKKIHCIVKNDGDVSNHKGVNIPNLHINLPYMSERDKNDLLFGIEQGLDFVAASFVRTAEDIMQIRRFLRENGGERINIISKIENREGVDNIDDIIAISDAIMVARGDMGVELPEEEVPVVQKMIIKKVYEAGKQVITATQMLDSMMKKPRPTRAEATDVANAVYDGTSAIMLSGETAAGKFPVEAVRMMVRIATRTEEDIDYEKRFYEKARVDNPDITDAICHATCTTAYHLGARAILTVTQSGYSARMISRYRPACNIIAGCTTQQVCRQLGLVWGVTPIMLEKKDETFELFHHAIDRAKEHGLLEAGDLTVITSGVPLGMSGTTNMIKVDVVGE